MVEAALEFQDKFLCFRATDLQLNCLLAKAPSSRVTVRVTVRITAKITEAANINELMAL